MDSLLLAKAANPIYACQLSPFPKSGNLLAYGTENLLVVAGTHLFFADDTLMFNWLLCLFYYHVIPAHVAATELMIDSRAIKPLKSFQVNHTTV